MLNQRHAWRDSQPRLDPDRLVFIDETWAKTNMARSHGWAPRGERLRMAVPHGHWNTTTFVAGLTRRGMIAPFVLPGAIRRPRCLTFDCPHAVTVVAANRTAARTGERVMAISVHVPETLR